MSVKRIIVSALGGVLIVGATAAVALAFWTSSQQTITESFNFDYGRVEFSAEGSGPTSGETLTRSENGEAVRITLPGSKLVEVLGQVALVNDSIIWRFDVAGKALGITGLDYSVNIVEQEAVEGAPAHSLVEDGVGKDGTVLAHSTVRLYPASVSGDCSEIPAVPPPTGSTPARNVYVFNNEGRVLQEAGAVAHGGTRTVHQWCVAMDWNSLNDGLYRNDVQAVGLAEDGTFSGAIASWNTNVGFAPALDLIGAYRNVVEARGLGDDMTQAADTAEWFADIGPDPSKEPGLVIEISPEVTNQNIEFALSGN